MLEKALILLLGIAALCLGAAAIVLAGGVLTGRLSIRLEWMILFAVSVVSLSMFLAAQLAKG